MISMMSAAQSWQDAAVAYGRLYWSAQEVMQRRTMQMALGQMRPEEAARMVFEKPAAFASAFERAARATVKGYDPMSVALAAVQPIGARTRANAKRLRRG
tara:strand:- start:241 stop:540 length:300 start_codon:yes stop_codon:yes gene_type:complete